LNAYLVQVICDRNCPNATLSDCNVMLVTIQLEHLVSNSRIHHEDKMHKCMSHVTKHLVSPGDKIGKHENPHEMKGFPL